MNSPILLIDIECTCDDQSRIPNDEMEIIEIGAIIVDLAMKEFDYENVLQIYVKPEQHPLLTEFCSDLTGIKQVTVDTAVSLGEAMTSLKSWCSPFEPLAWGSWGKFDLRHIENETHRKGVINPLSAIDHLNVKQLFARKTGHRVGLARAVSMSKLQFLGQHHSGIDDARNIARVLEANETLRNALLHRITQQQT